MMSIAVTIALVTVAIVLWRVIRKSRLPPIRPIAPRRAEINQSKNDDGSTLLTGVVIGSVLFGGDAHAQSTADSDHPPDARGDSGGSIAGGVDDGFSTGGDF